MWGRMQGILMNGWCEKEFKAFGLWRHEKVTKKNKQERVEKQSKEMWDEVHT